MWLGETCGIKAKKQAFVNIAAFLGQAMIETIIYDACEYIRLDGSCHQAWNESLTKISFLFYEGDENNWDKWNADVFKEPTSPAEIAAVFYPMSSR